MRGYPTFWRSQKITYPVRDKFPLPQAEIPCPAGANSLCRRQNPGAQRRLHPLRCAPGFRFLWYDNPEFRHCVTSLRATVCRPANAGLNACCGKAAVNFRFALRKSNFPLGEQRCARERMLRIGNGALRTREHRGCATRKKPRKAGLNIRVRQAPCGALPACYAEAGRLRTAYFRRRRTIKPASARMLSVVVVGSGIALTSKYIPTLGTPAVAPVPAK